MDDTDRKLLFLITVNPRIHFQELAEKLGITRQAVHRRMEVLTKTGVIQGTHAGVSFHYLDAVPVSISGLSKTTSIEETLDRLAESEFTRRVVVAGGNYLYVVGILRNISELDGYAEFVKRSAEMPEPTVGIYNLDDGLMSYSIDGSGKRRQSYERLSALDFRIIAAIKDDARKPIADISKTVGVSSKTVKRHLDEMMSDGSLEMNVPMDAAPGGDLLMIMHITLRDTANKGEVGRRLLSKNYFPEQYMRTHSNLPGLLMWVFWSDKMTEIRRALKETSHDEDVLSVMLNFGYLERTYQTWRDKLPELGMHENVTVKTKNVPHRRGVRKS